IPALAGQIYAMPGMNTQLNAVINKPGIYKGISANYSGKGFNYMDFKFLGKSKAGFKQWIRKIRSGKGNLTRAKFRALAKPSVNVPVTYYASYADGLYRSVVHRCFADAVTCQSSHSAHEASTDHVTVAE